MATGSITTLGLGSGLDLQNILDQLKAADKSAITRKENEKTELQKKVNAYNSVNAKLYAMKSASLSLSLQSNFMVNNTSVSDETILSATSSDGLDEATYNIDVIKKARRNSWESPAFDSQTEVMIAEPATGIATASEAVTTVSETMSIFYGEAGDQQQIDINLTAGMSLTDIMSAINDSSNNQDGDGNQLVSASVLKSADNEYYIRLAAADGGDSADSEITLADFDYVAEDTTVSITQGVKTMYLSLAAGTTYQGAAGRINDADNNPGFTAAVIDNGDPANPYQFTLTADDPGEDNRIISITNLDFLTEVTGAAADSLNAEFELNGITYQRQSNSSITDVIDGITLNLKKVGESTLTIERDLGSVKDDIMGLVENFNSLWTELNGTDETDGTNTVSDEESDNPLDNSAGMNRLIANLKSLFSRVIETDSDYTSLTDLGLTSNRNGTLTMNESQLDQAIASNPDAVKSLFIGDSENEIEGLGDILNDTLGDMVSSTGIVATEVDAAERTMDRITKDIEKTTEQLDKKYETMTQQFIRLDSYIRQLNSESSYMQSMFDSINKGQENK